MHGILRQLKSCNKLCNVFISGISFKNNLPDNFVEGGLDVGKLNANRLIVGMGIGLSTFNSMVGKDTGSIAFNGTLVVM